MKNLLIKLLGDRDNLKYFTAQKIIWLRVHSLLALLLTRKCVDVINPTFYRHISTQIVCCWQGHVRNSSSGNCCETDLRWMPKNLTLRLSCINPSLWCGDTLALWYIDGHRKKGITPVRQQWSCVFLAPTHQYIWWRPGSALHVPGHRQPWYW